MFLRYTTFIILFFGIASGLYAQQRPHFSMYMLNTHKLNPAYAGFDESLNATGVYRQQWNGLVGAPEQIQLNVHLPLFLIGGGVGLSLDSESYGARNLTKAELSYSYWLNISKNFQMAIGARVGISQHGIDGSILRAPEGIYEQGPINHQDPLIPISNVQGTSPVFGSGIHLRYQGFSGGISVENIMESSTSFDLNGTTLKYANIRHFMAYGSYDQEIGTNFSLKPSFLVRSDVIQTELNLGILIEYDGRFFAGGAYRGFNSETVDAFAIIVGASLNENISLSYSYDLTLSDLSVVSNGSHEIMLNYNLRKPIGKGKLPGVIYNSRF